MFETWIESREAVVKDDEMGESIPEVEELIRRHDDFLKAIDAQADKLDPIKRITMVCMSAMNILLSECFLCLFEVLCQCGVLIVD